MGSSHVKNLMIALSFTAALAACGSNGKQGAGTSELGVTGAGSTFVYPVLSAWAADYKKQAGANVNYQSIGSGGGIAQVKAGTVDFGATDQPLASDELAKSSLAQFPIVIGGIVPVINVSGLQPGKLKLTGPLLADIFAGKVKTWNDPAIAALNPGVQLPATHIAVVHRSDGSGTTFNFTHYLSQVSPTWKGGPGEGKSVNWPTGVGGKGNEGVAGYVKQIPNSIGYVEYAYVVQNKHDLRVAAELGRHVRHAERRELLGRGRKRRLGERQGLQPGHDQCAGRQCLSDHRDDLHPDAQAAQGQGEVRRSDEVLPLCAREGPGPGAEARLCPAARCACEADRRLISAPTSSERSDRPSRGVQLSSSPGGTAAG